MGPVYSGGRITADDRRLSASVSTSIRYCGLSRIYRYIASLRQRPCSWIMRKGTAACHRSVAPPERTTVSVYCFCRPTRRSQPPAGESERSQRSSPLTLDAPSRHGRYSMCVARGAVRVWRQ
eukprot:55751-Eustigmatos_ZCMA.PRE.1